MRILRDATPRTAPMARRRNVPIAPHHPRGRADFAWVMRHGRGGGAGRKIFNTQGHKALLRGLYRIKKFFLSFFGRALK